jgi:cytochrome c oxidase subunit 2
LKKPLRCFRPATVAALLPLALVAAGCGGGGGRQNVLQPESHAERRIATLWWVMLTGSAIGFGVIALLLFLGWARRNRDRLPFGGGERAATGLVVGLGIAVPIVVLVILFVWADIFVLRSTAAPSPKSTQMTIDVVGHQWFWEVRYPGTKAVTANEIHIPTRTRVNLVGTTADVIHSFWVPELNRKVDLVPGHPNRILLEADRPGAYRGQCAEFCGLQHAHMSMWVYAEPPARFRAWLANMAKPARAPAGPQARHGQKVFLSAPCASCHTIRGTNAQGKVGPDLTHLGTRTTLAALVLPNNRAALEEWLRDPQHVKPGNRMPRVPLSEADYRALATYLEGLR